MVVLRKPQRNYSCALFFSSSRAAVLTAALIGLSPSFGDAQSVDGDIELFQADAARVDDALAELNDVLIFLADAALAVDVIDDAMLGAAGASGSRALATANARVNSAESALRRLETEILDNSPLDKDEVLSRIGVLESDLAAVAVTTAALDLSTANARLEDIRRADAVATSEQEDVTPADNCEPLRRTDIPEIFRRALSLPGSRIFEFPGTAPRPGETPPFTVLHVFEERMIGDTLWLGVGLGPDCRERSGWVEAAAVEDWRTMLVMQFTPPGSRERVLFFSDETRLTDWVQADDLGYDARLALEKIELGDPPSQAFVAVEPKEFQRFEDRPFLMPILDWRYEIFADGTDVTLVQVAGLNQDGSTSTNDDPSLQDKALEASKNLKIGVKFVIDTTISMGPYIDRTRDAIRQFYEAMQARGLLGQTAFGLVGYRDNLVDPRIEYVTNVYQRLDLATPPSELIRRIEQTRPSAVPTKDWNEDALAGLAEAIADDDWGPFHARMIVLITDAGARDNSEDFLARYPSISSSVIRQRAEKDDIAIVAIHLQTPEAKEAGNVEGAVRTYRNVTRTGDVNTEKLLGVEVGDREAFRATVRRWADKIADGIATIREGRLIKDEGLQDSGADILEVGPARPASTERLLRQVDSIVTNELARAQLTYIGELINQTPPRFYRAWAADKDLTDPFRQALDVQVFLTRNQLNGLAQSLETIIDTARSTNPSPETFFLEIARLSAEVAVSGQRSAQPGAVTVGDMLPPFLRALPYRSRILKLNVDEWLALGATGRDQLISELETKLVLYRELQGDDERWLDFNDAARTFLKSDRGLQVSAVALALLP